MHGIHDDAIIRYFPSGAEQPSFARISDVRDRELSLVATTSIEDVCVGTISNTTGSGSIFPSDGSTDPELWTRWSLYRIT